MEVLRAVESKAELTPSLIYGRDSESKSDDGFGELYLGGFKFLLNKSFMSKIKYVVNAAKGVNLFAA